MALLEYICNGVESAAQSPWVEICATTKTAWENNFGTVSKMQVAAVELEKDAIAHEMSNQGNATQHQSAEFWGNGSGPSFAASLFRIAQSLVRTMLDHGSLLLSQSCNSRAIIAQPGRTVLRPCHYNFHWRPSDWQDNGGSQVELQNYATGHEMSTQQSEKQSLETQVNAGLPS